MALNVGREMARLKRMTPKQLRERYAEVFGEPTRSGNKQFMIKRILWRLQSLEQGTLSERALRRAEELANDADLRMSPPKRPPDSPTADASRTTTGALVNGDSRLPPPGTILTRAYKGRSVEVTVLERGFEHEGEIYRSLSAAAKAITGSHLNGFAFFNLGRST